MAVVDRGNHYDNDGRVERLADWDLTAPPKRYRSPHHTTQRFFRCGRIHCLRQVSYRVGRIGEPPPRDSDRLCVRLAIASRTGASGSSIQRGTCMKSSRRAAFSGAHGHGWGLDQSKQAVCSGPIASIKQGGVSAASLGRLARHRGFGRGRVSREVAPHERLHPGEPKRKIRGQ